jgi:hypothetical protein
MKRIKSTWPLLLLCLVASAALVGAASARSGEAELSSATKTLTVSASDCYPWSGDADYFNGAYYLRSMSGLVSFICPVHFPEYGTHQVQGITMYVQDTDSEDEVCAEVNKMDPSTGSYIQMGNKCSSGSTSGVRAFTISVTSNSVAPNQGMYFWVSMEGTTKLKLYGFRLTYSVSP